MKTYVSVSVICSKNGIVKPFKFKWQDGTIYKIDKVLGSERVAGTMVGGYTKRFTVLINEKEHYLFMEAGGGLDAGIIHWFVEEQIA